MTTRLRRRHRSPPSRRHRKVWCRHHGIATSTAICYPNPPTPRGHLTSAAICYSKPSMPVRRRGHLTSTVICFSLPRRLPRNLLPGHTMPIWCHRRGHLTSTVICFSFPPPPSRSASRPHDACLLPPPWPPDIDVNLLLLHMLSPSRSAPWSDCTQGTTSHV